MPRLPRYAVAGIPQHVIQRGTNRCPIFASEDDYSFFLQCMAEACERHRCLVHAYVLMTNHVHFLMTPERRDSTARVMHLVGTRYAQYFNTRHGRTGALWQGRYRDTLVDSERYLLICYKYIELNPVRAGMVSDPAGYRWSSHLANTTGSHDPLVTPHPLYQSLGPDAGDRRTAYRALFDTEIPADVIKEIRYASRKGWVLGHKQFKEEMERMTGRRARPSSRGGNQRQRNVEGV